MTNIDIDRDKIIDFKKLMIIIGGLIGLIILIIIIVNIIKKKSEDPIKYFIKLLGEETITMYVGDKYEEPGFKAYDSKENNLTKKVKITNNLNNNEVGEYKYTYELGDVIKARNVIIIEKPVSATIIHLYGEMTMYLDINSKYEEPGCIVFNTSGTDLNDKVIIKNNIKYNQIGSYNVVYSVVNDDGVTITNTRIVNITDNDVNYSLSTTNYTNSDVKINISAKDLYFSYMLLPDNTKITNSSYSYNVSKNGNYKFIIYSKKSEQKEVNVSVSNIDKEVPTGDCSGYYKDGKSYVTINAHDNIEISKYIVNGSSFTSNYVILSSEINSVSVDIYDLANNKNSISCKLEDKNVKDPSGGSSIDNSNDLNDGVDGNLCTANKIYKGKKYSLTKAQKEKLAAIVNAEFGSNLAGMKAVASHMANLYELRLYEKTKNHMGSIYEFAVEGGWYASNTLKKTYYSSNALQAVEDVLIKGNRTIPAYVVSFDTYPRDVRYADFGDYKDPTKYIHNVTQYSNNKNLTTTRTFWCFICADNYTHCNIMAWKDAKYKKYIEDNPYK